MHTPQHGDVPPGVWFLVLLGFVTLVPLSLLVLSFSSLGGLAVLAVTMVVGLREWRTWRGSRETTLAPRSRRESSIGRKPRRILGYAGRAALVLLAVLLAPTFVSGFVDGLRSSSSPGDPSSAGVVDFDAFWSPDSQLIAFDRSDYGSLDDKSWGASDVFVASADGSPLRRLTRTPFDETVLGWLSSPLRVVYATHERPRAPSRLYALALGANAPVPLGAVRAADELLALSHDARQVLVATPRGDPNRYALVDLVRNTRRSLPGTTDYWWTDGAWSPDDSMLAYVTGEGIVVLRGDRVLRRFPVGRYDSASGGLAWSPDGRQLAYGSSWSDSSELWLLRIENGNRSRLAGGEDTTDRYPVWSPDGRTIYYERGSFGDDDGLRAIAPNGTGDRKITGDDWGGGLFDFSGKNDRWLEEAKISPDGTRIVYLLGERGAWKNWSLVGVMDADGSDKTPFSGSS